MPKPKLTKEEHNVIRKQNVAKARETRLARLAEKKKEPDSLPHQDNRYEILESDYSYDYSYDASEDIDEVLPTKKQPKKKAMPPEKPPSEPAIEPPKSEPIAPSNNVNEELVELKN